MKTDIFKKIIKEAVREVFQEELKEILLESIKSSKQSLIKEHMVPQVDISSKPTEVNFNMKEKYMDVLNGMSMTSQDAKPRFSPTTSDPINGSLPEGEVGMDQIMNLMNVK
tara:strand:+ start:618 stop:950 length:333 start_codon:yes stop_codon:yes gene_type:complete